MSALHTVNKSPYEKNSLESCLRVAAPGSAILFIEDGVYAVIKSAAMEATLRTMQHRFKLYALSPDLAARGVSDDRIMEGVELVDYRGFVALAVSHDHVQSWL